MRGEAAFQLMGDWAKGEILAAGKVPGKDVLCTIGLDNSPVSISGDIFAFPVNADENTIAAQSCWHRWCRRRKFSSHKKAGSSEFSVWQVYE